LKDGRDVNDKRLRSCIEYGKQADKKAKESLSLTNISVPDETKFRSEIGLFIHSPIDDATTQTLLSNVFKNNTIELHNGILKRTQQHCLCIAFFQYCRPCAGRLQRQWRSRGGTNRRFGFTKEPEAAGQGAPAHTAPGPAAGESRRQSARRVYGGQLYYRSLAPAVCTAGRGLGRQWPPPTGDGSGTHPGHVCIGSGSTAAG
jgi:hypothetical protein